MLNAFNIWYFPDATAIRDLLDRIVKISTCLAVHLRARMAAHAEPSILSTTNAVVLPVSCCFSARKKIGNLL